jgi:DNA polymerase III gamma/tau subunit
VDTGLYQKHRPHRLKDIVGQDEAVAQARGLLKGATFPKAVLFFGPPGCGKTTLARILQRMIGCGDGDFYEYNSASFRGIDSAREIDQRMRMLSMTGGRGGKRVWLLDECFPACTLVGTPNGPRTIGHLQTGDAVDTIVGPRPVLHKFVNPVSVDRVVKLHLSDGGCLVTTCDHLVLTECGWVRAADLEGHCIFSPRRYAMYGNRLDGGSNHADVPVLPEGVRTTLQEQAQDVLEVMRPEAAPEGGGQRWVGVEGLYGMSGAVPGQEVESEDLLYETLSGVEQAEATGGQGKLVRAGISPEGEAVPAQVPQVGRGQGARETLIGSDEYEQPVPRPGGRREGQGDEREERDAARLAGRAWRQREDQPTSGPSVGVVGRRLDERGGHQDGQEVAVPSRLQSRRGEARSEIGDRGGWRWAQDEQRYAARCQEDPLSRRVRVDRVEIYQRGRNESSFVGYVSSGEMRQGVATFYDLQIDGHPSYFAEGVPVHNCHKWSSDAQDAMLKPLEEAPSHVHFFLCTTDPTKLKPAVRSRCTNVALKLVPDKVLESLVISVANAEGVDFDKDAAARVAEAANGSPRNALTILEGVLHLSGDDLQAAITKSSPQAQAIDLARLLIKPGASWGEVAKVLREVDDDPESLRRMVMGYCQSILLSEKPNPAIQAKAYVVLSVFRYHFYDSLKPGLTAACWEVVHSGKKS